MIGYGAAIRLEPASHRGRDGFVSGGVEVDVIGEQYRAAGFPERVGEIEVGEAEGLCDPSELSLGPEKQSVVFSEAVFLKLFTDWIRDETHRDATGRQQGLHLAELSFHSAPDVRLPSQPLVRHGFEVE